jgi:hypothetical protein
MTLYNPHLLPRQELIETFVARQPLLGELLDDLRRGGGQHHLLIGGRGTGKTTLLLRLAAAIEDDPKLVRRCIALRFPEEQYNISRPSDFWINALDALIDALVQHDERAEVGKLEALVTELEPLDEEQRAKRALTSLQAWAKRHKRLIVLLVDNLNLVLERLSESHWALREALSSDNGLVVVGASATFLQEAIDYQLPFYDFFHVHELGALSENDAREMVRSLASRANTPQVIQILERDPGRFKALYTLTGGTPRTLAVLHGVLALDHGDRIERDLDGLLDQLTPYYKARFDDLPSQSQVIINAVALHWHPITAAQCQAATHLDLNTVSAQLNRLVKGGLLTKVALPDPGKLGFQLSERFFNIWYLMRASRRMRRRLSWFIEFLRIFYGEEDLRRRAEQLIRRAPANTLSTPAKLLAFAAGVSDPALRQQLEFRAVGELVSQGIVALREHLDLEGEDRHLAPVLDRVRALRKMRTQLAATRLKLPRGHTARSVTELIAGNSMIPLEMKRVFAHEVVLGHGARVIDAMKKVQTQGPRSARLQKMVSTGELPSLGDVTTAVELHQIIEIEASPGVVGLFLVAREILARPVSDGLLRELLHREPSAAREVISAAMGIMDDGGWDRSRHLVLMATRDIATPGAMISLIVFFRRCISTRRGAQAVALLQDSGLAEHLAPLHEALIAAVTGTRGRLDGLAPEVRTVAAAIYDQLRSPTIPGISGSLATSPGLGAALGGLAASPDRGAPVETTVVSMPVAARKRIKPSAKQRKGSAGAGARGLQRLPPPR